MKTISWMFQLRSLKRPQSTDSPRFYVENVVRRLGIITPESGREDAANPSFSNQLKSLISGISRTRDV